MNSREYCVYILTNPSHTVLYIGVTGNLGRRLYEHQQKLVPGFSTKYNCTELVYVETTDYIEGAIEREKQLKNWSRKKKEWLINQQNPSWKDLSSDIL
jgi:putative endonuclease